MVIESPAATWPKSSARSPSRLASPTGAGSMVLMCVDSSQPGASTSVAFVDLLVRRDPEAALEVEPAAHVDGCRDLEQSGR